MSRKSFLMALVFGSLALMMGATAMATVVQQYDFTTRTPTLGPLAGQDGWSAGALDVIDDTAVAGIGTYAVGTRGIASRTNDSNWSFSLPDNETFSIWFLTRFTGTAKTQSKMDWYSTSTGADLYFGTEYNYDGSRRFSLHDNSSYHFSSDNAALNKVYKIRLEVDPLANSGAGSATLFYTNLTDSGTETAAPGLIGIAMGFTSVNRPSTINAMQFVTGWDGGGVDAALPTVTYAGVPEPSTLVMLAAGLVGLLCYAWRKRR